MKKLLLLNIAFIFFHTVLIAQSNVTTHRSSIKWMTFKQALLKNKTHPKKIIVDVYTDWCGWCKKMEATTYSDPILIQYMNKHFYCVKLDAETKETIFYKNKNYSFSPDNKVHDLAAFLLNGQMGYPTTVFLDENQDVITQVAGYQTTQQMGSILHYLGDNIYRQKTWEEYTR